MELNLNPAVKMIEAAQICEALNTDADYSVRENAVLWAQILEAFSAHRQADAAERQAAALERIAAVLENISGSRDGEGYIRTYAQGR